MAAFFIRKSPNFSSFRSLKAFFSKTKNKDDTPDARPIEEIQRSEALEILAEIFISWQSLWKNTKDTLGDLHLSEHNLRRVNFYETEQRRSVVILLSELLVAWELSDTPTFSDLTVALAKELRPSYPYVEYDPEETLTLSPTEFSILRNYIKSISILLKESISDLQNLATKRLSFNSKPLTLDAAEALLRDRLGLSYFDFVDFDSEKGFQKGYYPALLQESTDLNLI